LPGAGRTTKFLERREKVSISLKNACFQIWNTKYERKGIQSEFKPIFTRYIGVENIEEYDDVLKTMVTKFEEHHDKAIFFDGEIPLGDARIVSYFSEQLQSVDVSRITVEDVTLFDEKPELSQLYVDSLNYVLTLATEQEHFFNENIKRNFIKKLIVWSYHYLRNNSIVLEDSVNAKCLYYGEITRHEIYFLILLYRMTFDVIYVNPLKEEFWEEIDRDHLSVLHKNKQILPIETFKLRCQRGTVMERLESSTLQIERELESQLYTNGVYKPWQFRKGTTDAVFLHSTLIDLETSIHEPAKVRTGFSVKGDVVRVPYFFQKIEGEHSDYGKYCALVQKCMQGDHVLFLSDRGESILPKSLNRDDMLSLAFCMSGDGTCNLQKLKECPFYPLNRYKPEVQDLILQKINEVLADPHLFTCSFEKEDRLKLIMLLLHLHERVIRLIDNFDFPNQVPKLVIFLEHEDGLSNEMQFLLGFFSKVGFDLVIFDPSGMCNLSLLSSERMDVIRLETMKYEQTVEGLLKEAKRGGFLRKLFG